MGGSEPGAKPHSGGSRSSRRRQRPTCGEGEERARWCGAGQRPRAAGRQLQGTHTPALSWHAGDTQQQAGRAGWHVPPQAGWLERLAPPAAAPRPPGLCPTRSRWTARPGCPAPAPAAASPPRWGRLSPHPPRRPHPPRQQVPPPPPRLPSWPAAALRPCCARALLLRCLPRPLLLAPLPAGGQGALQAVALPAAAVLPPPLPPPRLLPLLWLHCKLPPPLHCDPPPPLLPLPSLRRRGWPARRWQQRWRSRRRAGVDRLAAARRAPTGCCRCPGAWRWSARRGPERSSRGRWSAHPGAAPTTAGRLAARSCRRTGQRRRQAEGRARLVAPPHRWLHGFRGAVLPTASRSHRCDAGPASATADAGGRASKAGRSLRASMSSACRWTLGRRPHVRCSSGGGAACLVGRRII